MQSVAVDDSVFGVPAMTEREILFYNTEIFAEAGIEVPTTTEELEAAAKKLHDPANGRFGIALRGQLSAAVTTFSGFLYSFGGDWVDESGNAAIDLKEAIAAYEFYGGLLRNYGPSGASSMDGAQARAIFQNGQAAMYIDPNSGAGLLEDPTNPPDRREGGYCAVPSGPAGMHPYDVTSSATSISEYSEKKAACVGVHQVGHISGILDAAMQNQKSPSPRSSSWEDPEVASGFSRNSATSSRSTKAKRSDGIVPT